MILVKNEFEEKGEFLDSIKLYKKYSDDSLEVNIVTLKAGTTIFISPPKSDQANEIFQIIKGKVYIPSSDKILSHHDIIILKSENQYMSIEAIENTTLMVTSIGFNSFDQTYKKMTKVSEILESIQNKDSYTKEHCLRLVKLSKIMAKALKLSDIKTMHLLTAARYHDLGKITICDEILNKPGKLNEDEYNEMKQHVMKTKELIPDYVDDDITRIASEHHERLDGSGYPNGLVGDEISFEGQVLAVLDTFDAMTTDRVYKKGKTYNQAFDELHKLGHKYNLDIVKLLESLLQK